jgi:hypothetical protein
MGELMLSSEAEGESGTGEPTANELAVDANT